MSGAPHARSRWTEGPPVSLNRVKVQAFDLGFKLCVFQFVWDLVHGIWEFPAHRASQLPAHSKAFTSSIRATAAPTRPARIQKVALAASRATVFMDRQRIDL